MSMEFQKLPEGSATVDAGVPSVDKPTALALNSATIHRTINQLLQQHTPLQHSNALSQHETVVNYQVVRNTLTLLQKGHVGDAQNIPEDLSKYVRDGDLQTDQHVASVDTLSKRYGTSVDQGLCNVKTVERNNKLTPPKKPSLIMLYIKQMFAGFNGVLCLAFTLGFISWQPIGSLNGAIPSQTTLAVSILLVAVVVLCSAFNFYQELAANQIVASLSAMVTTNAHALRDGQWIDIPADQLRLGDIVQVGLGDKVPADLRLVKVENMKLDLSMLTGESEPVSCTTEATSRNFMESRNQAFLGADVLEGSATGIVVAIGDNTVMGKVGKLTNKNKRIGGTLTSEINHFVLYVLTVGFTVAASCVLAWGVWIRTAYPGYLTVSGILQTILGLIIAFVPEGLPISVTVTLGITARRMYKSHVLVKDLTTVETFNTVSLIASDKTGTLTQNKMSVTRVILNEQQQLKPSDYLVNDASQHQALQRELLQYCISLCNNAAEVAPTEGCNADTELQIKGDASDTALYRYAAEQLGCGVAGYRQQHRRLHVLPFNSRNKFMVTINRVQLQGQTKTVVFLKGASEIVLSRCTQMMDQQSGDVRTISEQDRAAWEQRVSWVGKQGERGLGFGCLVLENAKYDEHYEYRVAEDGTTNYPSHELVFLGIVSLIDPAKPEVASALQTCREAHIRVAMVTGDHADTAEAIAKNIGLISCPVINRLKVHTNQETGARVLTCYSNDQLVGSRQPNMQGGSLATDKTLHSASSDSHEIWGQEGEQQQAVSLAQIEQMMGENGQTEYTSPRARVININDDLRNSHPHSEKINAALVVNGEQLECFDRELWSWALRHQEMVFARMTPEHKLQIVMEAQARGESVAVTGDGVNDAPALRAANLGIAMASGSEVAKEAGHMVLLDNNFNSIVSGIELGRTMFDNLKKVCVYLLPAGTYSEAITVIAQVFLGFPQPLGSFYMLMICVFTDVFLSTALMYETAESDIMKRPPRDRKHDRLVDLKLMFHSWLCIGTIESISAWTVFLWYMSEHGLPPSALLFAWTNWPAIDPTVTYYGIDGVTCNNLLFNGNALLFTTLVLCQFGNLLSARTRYSSITQHNPFWGKHRNYRVPIGMILAVCTVLVVTRANVFYEVFQSGVPELPWALAGLGFGACILLYDEARKYVVRSFPNSIVKKIAW